MARMMKMPDPTDTFPNDRELVVPSIYDNLYVLFLNTIIDYDNAEYGDRYANDSAVYEETLREFQAWWIQNHRPEPSGGWRI